MRGTRNSGEDRRAGRPSNSLACLAGGAVAVLLSLLLPCGCAHSSTVSPPVAPEQSSSDESQTPKPNKYGDIQQASSHPLRFRFRSLDGRVLSDMTLLGKAKLFVFLTTYDLASQTEASYVRRLVRRHPEITCAAFFLERPEDETLVDVYMKTVDLPCMAIVAPPQMIADSAFSFVHSVPTTVVLDGANRSVIVARGVVGDRELEQALRAAKPTGSR